MEKAVLMDDSFTERVHVHHPPASLSQGAMKSAPLSAEAEADLRALATEFADLCERADSFAQPVRAALRFVAMFGDSPPGVGKAAAISQRRVPVIGRGKDGD